MDEPVVLDAVSYGECLAEAPSTYLGAEAEGCCCQLVEQVSWSAVRHTGSSAFDVMDLKPEARWDLFVLCRYSSFVDEDMVLGGLLAGVNPKRLVRSVSAARGLCGAVRGQCCALLLQGVLSSVWLAFLYGFRAEPDVVLCSVELRPEGTGYWSEHGGSVISEWTLMRQTQLRMLGAQSRVVFKESSLLDHLVHPGTDAETYGDDGSKQDDSVWLTEFCEESLAEESDECVLTDVR